MDDLRWFAPNRYCALPVPALRAAGLRIAESGDAPARIAVAADGQCAVAGFEYAARHRCPLILYLWDLPPWRLGDGRPDPMFGLGARIIRIPRPFGGYRERAGYYSRIRFVARRATAVWCPSQQTTADVAERFGVATRQLPFCYDSDRFNAFSATARTAQGVPTLLAISRLVPSKNHMVLLRAAAQLPRPVMVRIIGRGPEGESLTRSASALGVTLRLDDGWANDEEIVAAYREAAVVVCPSRFEGFGLTPMEGLVMGRTVVASAIPVHREFVEGLVRLFEPDDADQLARHCAEALDAPAPTVPAISPLPELTIEACAERISTALEPLLR